MNSPEPSAWDVDESPYPILGVPAARLEYLVRYAILAPSTHNSQPWLFRVRGDALEIFADWRRALHVCDPLGRELHISCGAAIQFASLAAHGFGREGRVHLLPEPGNPDLLARLYLGLPWAPTAAEERRIRAIPRRHTNRLPFTDDPVAHLDVEALRRLAESHEMGFAVTSDPAVRRAISDLVVDADLRLMEDPAARRELARWIRPAGGRSADGMSVRSFGLPDWFGRIVASAMKLLDIGPGTALTHGSLASEAPWIGLLSTQQDDRIAWLRAGMALADIVLELTADGLDCSFLNQPVELPGLRPRVGSAIGISDFPQMLMRIGRGRPVPPAARRESWRVVGG
jgi:hypothetical protein